MGTKKCEYFSSEILESADKCPECGRDARGAIPAAEASANQPGLPALAVQTRPKSRAGAALGAILLVGLAIFVWVKMGLYTIQPIGALPQGITLVVWRNGNEPFFNSPDALCLKIQGGVSLLCRSMAMGQAPVERIILRLPYMEWAYLASTDGQSFSR